MGQVPPQGLEPVHRLGQVPFQEPRHVLKQVLDGFLVNRDTWRRLRLFSTGQAFLQPLYPIHDHL